MKTALTRCSSITAIALVALASAAHAGSIADDGAPFVGTLQMPRTTGMGGAGAAVASTNDALLINPAGLSQRKRYHLEVDGLYDAKFPAQMVDISIVDSSSAAVGTGLLFQRVGSGQPGGRGEGWDLGLGYAYPAGGYNFGGLTKYLRYDTPGGQVRQFAQDLGILGGGGGFSYAVVMQNISTSAIPGFPLTGIAGIAFGSDQSYRIAIDYKTDLSDTSNVKHRLNTGLEFALDTSIYVRGGYDWSPTFHQHWVSAGLAFITDRVSVSLAWQRRVVGPLDQQLQAGITLYLE
ncbi:MAG: hypothetical protein JST92_07750 [Deltaproteobacteria bacterium]|nr:hypothetical protein [Deltaproteobacteria bacterium]